MGLFSTKCSICGSLEHSTSNCPHGNLSVECKVCGSKDHATKDCPHSGFSTKCKVCGSKNHATKDCPHGAFSTECKVCGSKEHATKDCPHGAFSTQCKVCGSKNHATEDCPNGIITRKIPKKTSPVSYSSSSEDSGLTSLIAWLIGVAIVVFIVVWLAVNIVLPVILLNSALILTILVTFFRQRKKLFAALGLVGGGYMIIDIINGWFSANFVDNVVKNPEWISAFVYINAIAMGFCVWILIQPIWTNAKLIRDSNKSKSIVAFTSSILLITIISFSTPILYHSIGNAFISKSLSKNQILKRFEGLYLVPADEIVDEGELLFKLDSSKLIGISEQRVNPMGGLSKRKYEITSLNSRGEGTYIYSYEIFDRFGGLLQEDKSKSSGKIYFLEDKVNIGNDSYARIVPVVNNFISDECNILTQPERNQINESIKTYNQKYKIGVYVYIIKNLEGLQVDKFAEQLIAKSNIFESYFLILIKPKIVNERGQAHITYNGIIKNAESIPYFDIVNSKMIPFFKQNDYSGGISIGIKELYQRVN